MSDLILCPQCQHACGNRVDYTTRRTISCQYCGYHDGDAVNLSLFTFHGVPIVIDETMLRDMPYFLRRSDFSIFLGEQP